MRFLLLPFWLIVAAGWLSGITIIAKWIGGYQWIDHMGQSRPVSMLALVGASCAAAGLAHARQGRLPKFLAILVAAMAGVHLINALGLYMLVRTNGPGDAIMIPFALLASVLPTTIAFVGAPPSTVSIFILPVTTFLLLAASLAFGRQARHSDT